MNRQQLIEIAQWIRDNCIVIDTETTGLGENDTIVELAAVCPKTRKPLINTLVKPLSPMSTAAEKIHGIDTTKALYSGALPLEVFYLLHNLCYQADPKPFFMAAFNRLFDARMIMQTAFKSREYAAIRHAHQATREAEVTTCIMELANRYLHEHLQWDSEHSKFRRLSLEKCLEITGIQREGEAHRALSDALAAADLLNYIAEGKQP